jgi:DNA-binding HxlR family transcriptional regulator
MASRTNFAEMACSIARSWAVVGEAWTAMIIRDLYMGVNRFEQMRDDLGVSSSILADRLATLEHAGAIAREPYRDGGRTRDAYRLTPMGEDFIPVVIALTNWGDRWLGTDGPPAVLRHSRCGAAPVTAVVVCSCCGEPLKSSDTHAFPGPGARRAQGTMLIAPSRAT